MQNTLLTAKRIEVALDAEHVDPALREEYENTLVVSLARFGYAPYITDSGVGFTVEPGELTPAE